MRPTRFPQQNVVWAEDQPPYLPLPAYTDETQAITRWELTWRERIKLLFTGHIWLRQMNFGRQLQPQLLELELPFVE